MRNHTLIKSGLIMAFLAETICVSYALKFFMEVWDLQNSLARNKQFYCTGY